MHGWIVTDRFHGWLVLLPRAQSTCDILYVKNTRGEEGDEIPRKERAVAFFLV
jgi:hypothetical protein